MQNTLIQIDDGWFSLSHFRDIIRYNISTNNIQKNTPTVVSKLTKNKKPYQSLQVLHLS